MSGHFQEVISVLSKILYALLESSINSINSRSLRVPICVLVFPLCQAVSGFELVLPGLLVPGSRLE